MSQAAFLSRPCVPSRSFVSHVSAIFQPSASRQLHPPSLPTWRRGHAAMAHLPASPRTNVMVTWDIDGTLLGGKRRGNLAHKHAIERAVADVYGVRALVHEVPYAGCTDKAIVASMCKLYKVDEATIWSKMDACTEKASAYIEEEADDDMTDAVLPGVHRVLSALNQRRVFCGLVTGNFEHIGWAKMKRAGLRDYFSFGAFGSDCLDRDDILALAIKRAQQYGFTPEKSSRGHVTNVFHVGDAVADMRAARHVHGRGIAVLTGAFSREQLAQEEPHMILEDLSDTVHVLAALGLEEVAVPAEL